MVVNKDVIIPAKPILRKSIIMFRNAQHDQSATYMCKGTDMTSKNGEQDVKYAFVNVSGMW